MVLLLFGAYIEYMAITGLLASAALVMSLLSNVLLLLPVVLLQKKIQFTCSLSL